MKRKSPMKVDAVKAGPALRRSVLCLTLLAFSFAVPAFAAADEETLANGVTAKVVTYYSEHVACYGRLFFPKGFDAEGSTPGVVLANGWTGTAGTLERYAQVFAEHGLVAMAIDYRGWGKSGGFVRLAEEIKQDDRLRFAPFTAKVRIKRTRILPEAQLEDIFNAISYLQGEPGVDREAIGVWGTSFAGGHAISMAARDGRVKAIVAQVPAIRGKDIAEAPFELEGEALEDAIRRARTGEGATFNAGLRGNEVIVDAETRQAVTEYLPFHQLDDIPAEVPALFIIAENDSLVDNATNAGAAHDALEAQGNTTGLVVIPGIDHFDVYRDEPFDIGSKAAAEWFSKHLGTQ